MRTPPRRGTRQQGAALILFITILVMGIAWYTVGALGKAPVATAEREIRTGRALQEGKQALLAYVAQYAARSDTADPGQLPCPESLSLANPGESSTSCSATALVVGRLPWKTLGIDELRDGRGEPLWYMMRGFRNPPINFGTPGQLTENGALVVAMIIAPGVPLNTLADPGVPPAGCSKLGQNIAARNVAPLVASNFLECGSATGSIANPGDSRWTNDRVIAITAAEWADAIAPAIADRLQRQVAPAMETFRSTTSLNSWGQRFLPNASTFNAPPGNDLCGDNNTREGMPPTATVASAQCNTSWVSYSLSGLGVLLSTGGCSAFPAGTPTEVRCDFTMLLGGAASPTININAPNIGYSFRYVDTSQITIQVNAALPPYPTATTGNYGGSVAASDGRGTFSFEVFFPFLTIASTVRIRIPYPADALLADARSAWYVTNGWDRYTYYGVARPATSDPAGTCSATIFTDCLNVSGTPSPNIDNNKRLVLVLMGSRGVPGQSWSGVSPVGYLEGDNGTAFDRSYAMSVVTSSFNDRIATCPFNYLDHGGANVSLCN